MINISFNKNTDESPATPLNPYKTEDFRHVLWRNNTGTDSDSEPRGEIGYASILDDWSHKVKTGSLITFWP